MIPKIPITLIVTFLNLLYIFCIIIVQGFLFCVLKSRLFVIYPLPLLYMAVLRILCVFIGFKDSISFAVWPLRSDCM